MQYGSHQSLKNCYSGIENGLKEGLEAAGKDFESYEIVLKNDNFDASVSQANAKNLIARNAAIIGAIATPSAAAAINNAAGAIPVVYCAVTDPSVFAGAENYAGSSDVLDFKAQLELIKAFIPGVQKVGVLYTVTEANSLYQIKLLKEEAAKQNVTIIEKGITVAGDVNMATQYLLSQGADCLTNLTDNTVVGALDAILTVTDAAKIPVFGSEVEQVKKGCLASVSLDYVELGRQTGLLMSDILLGKQTADKQCLTFGSNYKNYYNGKVAASLNLTLSSSYTAEITDTEGK